MRGLRQDSNRKPRGPFSPGARGAGVLRQRWGTGLPRGPHPPLSGRCGQEGRGSICADCPQIWRQRAVGPPVLPPSPARVHASPWLPQAQQPQPRASSAGPGLECTPLGPPRPPFRTPLGRPPALSRTLDPVTPRPDLSPCLCPHPSQVLQPEAPEQRGRCGEQPEDSRDCGPGTVHTERHPRPTPATGACGRWGEVTQNPSGYGARPLRGQPTLPTRTPGAITPQGWRPSRPSPLAGSQSHSGCRTLSQAGQEEGRGAPGRRSA